MPKKQKFPSDLPLVELTVPVQLTVKVTERGLNNDELLYRLLSELTGTLVDQAAYDQANRPLLHITQATIQAPSVVQSIEAEVLRHLPVVYKEAA